MAILQPIMYETKFEKLKENAIMPELNEGSYYIYSCNEEEIELQPKSEIEINTGIKIIAIPQKSFAVFDYAPGYIMNNYLMVKGKRSNLENTEYKVKVINPTNETKTIPYGARLGKLTFYPKKELEFTEIDVLNDIIEEKEKKEDTE